MLSPKPEMCKSQSDTMAAEPKPRTSNRASRSKSRSSSSQPPPSTSSAAAAAPAATSTSYTATTSSSSSHASLTSLRDSLPETLTLYRFSEISSATNHFLASRLSSSSSWRCTLRGRDAVIVQRPFLSGDPAALPARLSALSRAHYSAVVPLLGASLAPPYIYLVYEYANGASLSHILRNPRNPNYTPIASWSSRVQIAADVAQGLDYIHHHSASAAGLSGGPVHNRIKSSSVIVSDPELRARICHFGAAALSGEIAEASSPRARLGRSDSRRMRIQGTRGYMAPELIAGGRISQRSDVYAFGVVLLELLSGEEPVKYKYQTETKDFGRISLIDTARKAIGAEENESEEALSEERAGRVRRWMDGRLRDSFPVEAAERLIKVALRCVSAEAAARPGMEWVAGKVSKVLVEAKAWEERFGLPTDFSVSMAPR